MSAEPAVGLLLRRGPMLRGVGVCLQLVPGRSCVALVIGLEYQWNDLAN